jgi:hypothetical protein
MKISTIAFVYIFVTSSFCAGIDPSSINDNGADLLANAADNVDDFGNAILDGDIPRVVSSIGNVIEGMQIPILGGVFRLGGSILGTIDSRKEKRNNPLIDISTTLTQTHNEINEIKKNILSINDRLANQTRDVNKLLEATEALPDIMEASKIIAKIPERNILMKEMYSYALKYVHDNKTEEWVARQCNTLNIMPEFLVALSHMKNHNKYFETLYRNGEHHKHGIQKLLLLHSFLYALPMANLCLLEQNTEEEIQKKYLEWRNVAGLVHKNTKWYLNPSDRTVHIYENIVDAVHIMVANPEVKRSNCSIQLGKKVQRFSTLSFKGYSFNPPDGLCFHLLKNISAPAFEIVSEDIIPPGESVPNNSTHCEEG